MRRRRSQEESGGGRREEDEEEDKERKTYFDHQIEDSQGVIIEILTKVVNRKVEVPRVGSVED